MTIIYLLIITFYRINIYSNDDEIYINTYMPVRGIIKFFLLKYYTNTS